MSDGLLGELSCMTSIAAVFQTRLSQKFMGRAGFARRT